MELATQTTYSCKNDLWEESCSGLDYPYYWYKGSSCADFGYLVLVYSGTYYFNENGQQPSPVGGFADEVAFGCTIGGSAAKDVIDAATVKVYAVDSDGANYSPAMIETVTDSDGSWTVTPDVCYSLAVYRVEIGGGSFISEATQDTVSNTVSYTAIVDLNSIDIILSAESLSITPLSTFVDDRATYIISGKGGLSSARFAVSSLTSAVTQATDDVKNFYGLTKDPLTTTINFTNPDEVSTNSNGTAMALILGTFTQQAEFLFLDDPGSLLTALSEDFSDGNFDGKLNGVDVTITDTAFAGPIALPADAGTTGFTDAMERYVANPKGSWRLNGFIENTVSEIIESAVDDTATDGTGTGGTDGTFTGTWSGTATQSDICEYSGTMTMVLEESGSTVTGTISMNLSLTEDATGFGCLATRESAATDISGTVSGSSLSFSVTGTDFTGEGTLSGDTITGTTSVVSAGATTTGTFSVTKQ